MSKHSSSSTWRSKVIATHKHIYRHTIPILVYLPSVSKSAFLTSPPTIIAITYIKTKRSIIITAFPDTLNSTIVDANLSGFFFPDNKPSVVKINNLQIGINKGFITGDVDLTKLNTTLPAVVSVIFIDSRLTLQLNAIIDDGASISDTIYNITTNGAGSLLTISNANGHLVQGSQVLLTFTNGTTSNIIVLTGSNSILTADLPSIPASMVKSVQLVRIGGYAGFAVRHA